ncbi:MAG: TonB-dependent receptor [Bacteroidetes bacterium]|nr:MAG: TonB-dependent receptor [Bacteroidota bacterium]
MKALFLICLLYAYKAQSQNAVGKILDEAGLPLQGATVVNLRSDAHAHANEVGYFILPNTIVGDSIKVSHISYQTSVFVYTTGSQNNIRLIKTEFQLSEVVVNSNARHLNIISAIDTKINPVNSSQELLRRVPGLFIGQHAGGGKAEQIFLRGFDIDHGTDINITVDGMPVNMVSHAHGQGYADLHFLIPETVDKIDFDKGPYYADHGNMATAGYVAFKTKDRLDNSSLTVEAGKFNTLRTLGMFNLLNTQKQTAYIATEYLSTDGYFQSPQNFYRLNIMGKYAATLSDNNNISVSFSHLASKWNASGQVPERAVAAGLITRFGSIDNTEGGYTSRTNFNLQHFHRIDNNTSIKSNLFYTKYSFELYSNFTFFLNNPINGDQIRQKENRDLAGFESVVSKQMNWGNASINWQTGLGLRYDMAEDVELSRTLNRKEVMESLNLGNINEANVFAYSSAEIRLGKWLINSALRVDNFKFDYADQLTPTYQNSSVSKSIVSPKLNFIYTKNSNLQCFLKLGKGFHSNDTRVITTQTNRSILPAAYGADAGTTWKPFKNLVVNSALWYLFLQEEFIYVGDEAIVEPSGKTERNGMDLGVRWQLNKYIFLNSDFTYTFSKTIEEDKANNYLPLAPRATFAGGIIINTPSGFAGALKTRHLGNRAANEDNSIVAKGYTITDLNLNYSWKKIIIGAAMENIFNAKWKETQFATESRLLNEPQPRTEIHSTPGTPFNFRGTITFNF